MMPAIHKIFIGGGGDDWISNIVENYAANYATRNPNFVCPCFSWTERFDIRAALNSVPRDANVTVVGHSYGADSAFSALLSTAKVVDVLISIDPVGRIRPSWAEIRGTARTWLNVRAEPSDKTRNVSDTIAGIGGRYPRPPASGQPSAPNHSIFVNAPHGFFGAMMRATQNGVSGTLLLGGNSVA